MFTLNARAVLVSGLLFIVSDSFAGWFGPSNYDQCILDGMKGITSDVAARSVRSACGREFPSKTVKVKLRELSQSELKKLDGRSETSYGFFKGSLYNGNSGVTLEQVTISITTKSKAGKVLRTYVNDIVSIPPLATGDFIFQTIEDSGLDYSWTIDSAKGH